MPRLFVAVELPADVREAVASAVAPLRAAMPGLKWVAPERYHLTLVFLGSVDDAMVAPVADAMTSACRGVAPFRIGLDRRVGSFGRRVLWAGVAPSPELRAVAGFVAEAVGRVVALPDAEREFRAHLTLARAGREKVRMRDATVPALTWDIKRVVLLRSAGGYSVERAVDLVADA